MQSHDLREVYVPVDRLVEDASWRSDRRLATGREAASSPKDMAHCLTALLFEKVKGPRNYR